MSSTRPKRAPHSARFSYSMTMSCPRHLLTRVIKRMGRSCIESSFGEDALDLYRRHDDIELIISDMLMPGMNGTQFAEHLFRDFPHARLLFISGLSHDDFGEILERENVAFLQKPFTPKQLVAAIERHIVH